MMLIKFLRVDPHDLITFQSPLCVITLEANFNTQFWRRYVQTIAVQIRKTALPGACSVTEINLKLHLYFKLGLPLPTTYTQDEEIINEQIKSPEAAVTQNC